MNSGRAFGEEFAGLGDALADADFFGFGRVVAGGFEVLFEAGREAGAAEAEDANDLFGGENGEKAGNDWDVDAECAGGFDEFEVVGVVVEKLGDDGVGPGFDFAREVREVGLHVWSFDVFLRITSDGYAKIISVVGADVSDEFVGVAEAVGGFHERHFAAGWIAAESDDVLDAGVLDVVEDFVDVIARGADAG
jgi:hypothetical protein